MADKKPQTGAASAVDPNFGLRRAHILMALSTVVFIAFSIAYNFLSPYVTPVGLHWLDGGMANPDEHDHYQFVAYLAQHGSLPPFGHGGGNEAHQPPLYYILAALLYHVSASPHAIRFLSCVLGIISLWAMFWAVKTITPNRPVFAVFVASIAAFIPMNLSLCSAVNNDSLANLIFALAIWRMAILATWRDGGHFLRDALLLGVVLGVGIWSKMSAALLFPVVVVFWMLLASMKAMARRDILKGALVSLGAGLLIAAPWLAHNYFVSGDLLGVGTFLKVLESQNNSPQKMIAIWGLKLYFENMFSWTFASYWGVFDSMLLFYLPQVYALALIMSIISIGGLFRFAKGICAHPGVRALVWSFVVLFVLDLISFVQYNVHFFQAQGRYFFPCLLPLTLAFVGGIDSLLPPRRKGMAFAFLIGLFGLFNLLALVMMQARYGS